MYHSTLELCSVLACCLLLVGLVGCSSDGEGPTAPPAPTPTAAGATVTGQVVAGNQPGMTVRIQGTDVSAPVGGAGRFSLSEVPVGNQTLVFAAGSSEASAPLDGVQNRERIELQVQIQGSTATITSMDRQVEGEDDGAEVDLNLQVSPDDWNVNWVRSNGTVAAFLRGPGFEDVDLDSLLLVGDDPAAEPLEPLEVTRQGDHVRARFAQADAFRTLLEPEPGDFKTVTILFTVDGEEMELTHDIVVVGPGEDDEEDEGEDDEPEDEEPEDDPDDGVVDLRLQLAPDVWNTNTPNGNGNLQALIRGSGFDRVDLDSIELVGTDPDAAPLAPASASIQGNHVQARFSRADAYATLDEPESGDTHTVTVRLTVEGEPFEVSTDVRIVGP